MITLFILAVMLIATIVYGLMSFIIGYGPALFVILDIAIAVKILSCIFKPRKNKNTDLSDLCS